MVAPSLLALVRGKMIPYKRELAAWLTKLGTATESSAGADGRHILRVVIPLNLEGFGVYAGKLCL